MLILDTAAARRELDRLRPEIARLTFEPVLVHDLARRLSQLATQVAAACEVTFLRLMEAPAA
jgi:hypothetical protein